MVVAMCDGLWWGKGKRRRCAWAFSGVCVFSRRQCACMSTCTLWRRGWLSIRSLSLDGTYSIGILLTRNIDLSEPSRKIWYDGYNEDSGEATASMSRFEKNTQTTAARNAR